MSTSVIEVKTVIIGAGISGISAALNLLNNNYTNFVVFEALERIGGRICTQTDEKGYLEIGAQWIHGQEGNPIYHAARDHNLVKPEFKEIQKKIDRDGIKEDNNIAVTPEQISQNVLLQNFNVSTNSDKTVFLTQTGQKISYKFAQSVYDTLTKLIYVGEELNLNPAANQSISDSRVGDFLADTFNQVVEKELKKFNLNASDLNLAELKRILNGIFLMRAKRENIRSGCSSIFNVSLKNFSAYKEFAGHSYVELSRGYSPIIDVLIGNQKNNLFSRINLNHFMKKIYLCQKLEPGHSELYAKQCFHCKYASSADKVVVRICNATNPNEPKEIIAVCENVLCTVSLGYLKENLNTLVEPLRFVSDEKRLAVSRLGFGTINKIFLFYEKPFWTEELELVNLIWLPDNENFNVDKLTHRNSPGKMWFEDICKFEVVNSYPNALSGWIAGSEDFERLDDKTIAIQCTKLLRKFMANESIPEPVSIIRTKWNMNKFSRGSYSHLPIGSDPKDLDVLAKPIPSENNPLIMFAGEATNSDYFSTTHGAYLTGIRESERILRKNKANSHI